MKIRYVILVAIVSCATGVLAAQATYPDRDLADVYADLCQKDAVGGWSSYAVVGVGGLRGCLLVSSGWRKKIKLITKIGVNS